MSTFSINPLLGMSYEDSFRNKNKQSSGSSLFKTKEIHSLFNFKVPTVKKPLTCSSNGISPSAPMFLETTSSEATDVSTTINALGVVVYTYNKNSDVFTVPAETDNKNSDVFTVPAETDNKNSFKYEQGPSYQQPAKDVSEKTSQKVFPKVDRDENIPVNCTPDSDKVKQEYKNELSALVTSPQENPNSSSNITIKLASILSKSTDEVNEKVLSIVEGYEVSDDENCSFKEHPNELTAELSSDCMEEQSNVKLEYTKVEKIIKEEDTNPAFSSEVYVKNEDDPNSVQTEVPKSKKKKFFFLADSTAEKRAKAESSLRALKFELNSDISENSGLLGQKFDFPSVDSAPETFKLPTTDFIEEEQSNTNSVDLVPCNLGIFEREFRQLQKNSDKPLEVPLISGGSLIHGEWEAKATEDISTGLGTTGLAPIITSTKVWSDGTTTRVLAPRVLQRRKHQINWLANEAAEKEFELMEQTRSSRLSRYHTQMKYGW